MKDKISTICKNLEKEKKVKILFAVENGSRAWRIDSKDSDYDVRFVFVWPLKEYIQINKPSEVIEAFNDKQGKPCSSESAFIDINGFDIFKFVKMLSSSNPTTIEWLMSDIVYFGKQNPVFKKFAIKNFNKNSLYHHYKSMCRNNYLKYLKSGDVVTYKKYLYAYRGLINAKWVVYKKSVPPIIFRDALKGLKDFIPQKVYNKLNEIIELKAQGKEKEIVENIVIMDRYIESFLEEKVEFHWEKSHSTLLGLNEELRRIILSQNNK